MEAASHMLEVLVVDDDEMNLKTFVRVFRGQLQVHCAQSGEEALRLLATRSFDVMFVDYSMPGMRGTELIRRVARTHPTMRKVILSAYDHAPEFQELKAQGLVVAVISKPWDKQQIVALLQQFGRDGSR